MWSIGRGPLALKPVKLSAVETVQYVRSQQDKWVLRLTGSNDCIVCRIDINGLVKREPYIAGDDRPIDGCGEFGYSRIGQARNKFLDVSDSLCGCGWIPRPEAVPEGEVCLAI
jgi:hypothetical protein